MSRRLRHRAAFLLLALVAFMQWTPAQANCGMSSMEMAAMSAMDGPPCQGCETPCSDDQTASVCATECATIGQPISASAAAVRAPAIQRVALVLRRVVFDSRSSGLDGPLPGAPPRRILLHSFLI